MKTSFRLLSIAAVSALLCCATSAALAQSKIVLKLAHSDSVDLATSRKAVMADTFAKEVKAKRAAASTCRCSAPARWAASASWSKA